MTSAPIPTDAELAAMKERLRFIYTTDHKPENANWTWNSFTHEECTTLLAAVETLKERLKAIESQVASEVGMIGACHDTGHNHRALVGKLKTLLTPNPEADDDGNLRT